MNQKFQFDTIFEPEHMMRNDPIYSQHHLDQVLAQATTQHYQSGFETGQQEMQKSIDAVNAGHLQLIHGTLANLVQVQKNIFETLEEHTSAICREITEKMLPTFVEQGAMDEILTVLTQAFEACADQDTLKIHVAEKYLSGLIGKMTPLMNQHPHVNVVVSEDHGLGASECRVEWKTGGVERMVGHIQDQIDVALARLTASAEFKGSELKEEVLQVIEEDTEHAQRQL